MVPTVSTSFMASNRVVSGAPDFVFTEADAKLDPLVGGISRLGLWSLWLIPERLPIDALQLKQFLDAFTPASVQIWHVSDGGNRSAAIKQKLRAFGQHAGLAEEVTSRMTLEVDQSTYYADTASVGVSDPELAAFLSRSTAGADSALVVLPDVTSESFAWTPATLPLLTLWLGRSTVLAGTTLGDDLLMAFIHASTALDVIPILPCFDASMRPSLAAIGPSDRLAEAARHLDAASFSTKLEERLSRGLRPQAIA